MVLKSRLKYIVFRGIGALVFPEAFTHSLVACGFNKDDVESAGFVDFDGSSFSNAHGKSDSLDKSHMVGDLEIIKDSYSNYSHQKYFNKQTKEFRHAAKSQKN